MNTPTYAYALAMTTETRQDSRLTPPMIDAYNRGRRSQRTHVEWDDALVRFSRKACPPHPVTVMCDLEHAWASGWSDGSESRPSRHALTCPNGGVTFDHGVCEDLS